MMRTYGLKRIANMGEGGKISLIYSVITIAFVVMAGIVFYFMSSRYVENLYFKYLDEKAHAVAVEKFEKDELDSARYHNVVLHRQNSIPTSQELFVDMADGDAAREKLRGYLTDEQIRAIGEDKEVNFKRGDDVGTAFVYYDNEGTYAVVVLSRNPYGEEINRNIGWVVLALVLVSALVLYLISRLYSMKVVDRIDRNYRTEKMFVNNASHEINNPLTAIQGECDIALMRDRTPEEYRGFLMRISEETGKVVGIMRNLLQFSHTRSRRFDKHALGRIDAGAMMQSYAGAGVRVDVRENFLIVADEQLLDMAMRNIVGNARKYSDGSVVEITVDRDRIEVRDHGRGIPAGDAAHIFEPFYRAGNSADVPGHGIGLALAKEIVEKFGGTVSVSSVEGESTAFVVKF